MFSSKNVCSKHGEDQNLDIDSPSKVNEARYSYLIFKAVFSSLSVTRSILQQLDFERFVSFSISKWLYIMILKICLGLATAQFVAELRFLVWSAIQLDASWFLSNTATVKDSLELEPNPSSN